MKKPLKNIIEKADNPLVLRKIKITLGLIIAVFAFCLYAQSITFNYVLDDFGVIKDNRLVEKGISSIPELLRTDRLFGGNNDALRMPEYRPLPLIMFAVEWQISPDNPHFYHFINVLLYAISCWLLFLLLCKLFKNQNFIFPFICTLLYVVHPIHTEVVDNIKSLDEILCFLFSIISILFFLKSIEKQNVVNMISGVLLFFIALLSKESAIAFLIIIPLMLFVFTQINYKKLLLISISLLVVTGIFLLIRHNVINSISKERMHNLVSPEINSLLAAPDWLSEKATAFYILLRYILLLIFPYQLAYDYSIAEIPIQSISSPLAIVAILIYLALGIYALIKIRKKDIVAFAILFYLIALAPVSNLFILINWTMAERFLFIPSLGFCIILTLLLIKISKTEINRHNYSTFSGMLKTNSRVFIILLIILGLYSFRTLSRNPDWKDNTALITHDVKVVPNNAFAHYNYGFVMLYTLYPEESNSEKQESLLRNSISEFSKAISIYNDFADAYAGLGVAYAFEGDYPNAILNYEMALKSYHYLPSADVFCDLGLLYCNTGQYAKAISILDTSLKYYPKYGDAYAKKSHTLLIEGKNMEAIAECEKLKQIDANNVFVYLNIGCAHLNMGQYDEALTNLNKATEIDPVNADCLNALGLTYQRMGDSIKATQYFEKIKNIKQN